MGFELWDFVCKWSGNYIDGIGRHQTVNFVNDKLAFICEGWVASGGGGYLPDPYRV